MQELEFPYQYLLKDYSFGSQTNFQIAFDIVDVMYLIYHFDISTKPKENQPRTGIINIPVTNVKLWMSVKPELEKLVNWVSEDNISFKFNEVKKQNQFITLLSENTIKRDVVTLFSGGLDSLAGAYENYFKKIDSDYTGFVNNDPEGNTQRTLRNFYHQCFPNNDVHIIKMENQQKKKHHMQSTRSLLYLSLAISKAISVNSNKVFIYENGILSLNPEIHGRNTTKTTHPRTIFLFNSILEKLNVDIKIINPFTFKTKGEVINSMNSIFKEQIKSTHTCGKSRLPRQYCHKGQCGVCIPCLLRKISMAAYDLESYDVKYHYDYGIKPNQIKEPRVRKDFISNIDYFYDYVEYINNGTIFHHLELSSEYYEDGRYLTYLQNMFKKFYEEFERFWSKYGIY
ncbi:hypothetical protein ETC01_16210 [Geobacillus sp. NFOSA3]|uniref:hypothetical protein n=1 Tax=Parageobacillus toebii TaxID=153151 RepID=UPI0014918B5D|nr:hypothetical protein [Geobacillus sp. NFOSA3]